MRNPIHRILSVAVLFSAGSLFAATASENWENLCAKCHAADGTGNTKVGKKLKVKDYTDAKALADYKDEQLAKDILEGVSKDGKDVMKGYKDELKPEEAKELVVLIRKFAKK